VVHTAGVTTDASWLADMPDRYDRLLGPALFEPFAGHLAERAATSAPRRVLELAAGTGITTRALRQALPTSEITATDLNAAMVAWGSSHVDGVSWAQADAQDLHFPDDSFDLLVSQFGFMFFPDKPGAAREMARVLAPGGRLLLSVWDELDRSDFPAALVQALAVVLPDDPPDFVARVPHGYADPSVVRSDLAAGGLVTGGIEYVVLVGRAESAQALAEGFCLGTPLRFALQERGSLENLTRRVGDEMAHLLGDGPLEGQAAALVIAAHLIE
jgi:SAM-dependent methyltransferase